MHSNWLALGAALCAFALGGYGVAASGRILAALALATFLLVDRRRAVVLSAVALGFVAALRVGSPPPSPPDPSAEQLLALELSSPAIGGRARGWMVRAGDPPIRVRIGGLGEEDLPAGSRLLVRGRIRDLRRRATPDRRDAYRTARARGDRAGVTVREILRVVHRGRAAPLQRWREDWVAGLDTRLGSSSGLWRALVLADAAAIGDRARERVQRLGLAHLLALSGLHTSIVAAALLWPLRRRGRRGLVFAVPVLAAWMVLAGSGPSLTRAVAMAAWWVVARARGRPAAVEDALGAAALAELALRPLLLCGVGWWLSYAATLGVVRALRATGGWPAALRGIGVSVAAQLATLPWALDAFGLVNLLAPMTLLVAGPVFAAVLVAGLAGLALGGVLDPARPWIDPVVITAGHVFGGTLAVASPLAAFSFAGPGLDGIAWTGALIAAAAGLWPVRGLRRTRIALLVAGIALWLAPTQTDHEWVVFDVGQGDGIALRCGAEVLLVDTGPRYADRSPAAWTLVDWLERRSIRSARVLVTHGHLDHRGGMAPLLATGRIVEVFVALTDSGEAWVGDLRAAADAAGARVRTVGAGEVLRVGHCAPEVLWPPAEAASEHSNDRSLVLRWATPGGDILLTGDLERRAERELLARGGLDGPARWLKVAHHGGDTGTDAPWLDLVRPGEAVISSGAGNRYGHPDPALLGRLAARDVEVHRIDRCGFFRLRWSTDGQRMHRDCGAGP